ncbi:MAG: lipoprotein of unknown function [Bacteriovoracaceae bacterium]|nr:lipoprotein of unknown function [Bacteriovoracaceae bacterium]
MRFHSYSFIAALALISSSCSDSSGPSDTSNVDTPNGNSLPALSGNNVLPITVNGSLCSTSSYLNKPCVSVQVCIPGTTTCVTVNDILLDTGSYGFRVFKSALNGLALTPITNGANTLTECAQFGSGSDWGPIEQASLILGGEPAVQLPIQVIDSSFATVNNYCNGADDSATAAGFNGILGVGLLPNDCGDLCSAHINNRIYFGCNGATCTATNVTVNQQVQNPVALLPEDNNGVIVQLPSISLGGVSSIDGYLVLGIGTQSNNVPSGVTAYPADSSGEFKTVFNGNTVSSFIDTGSNGFSFESPSASTLPECTGVLAGWYCPTSVVKLNPTNTGQAGSPKGTVQIQIGNFSNLASSGNKVFIEIGESGQGFFDFGLPFFIGRNVYVGIAGTTSPLGTGPYWAY